MQAQQIQHRLERYRRDALYFEAHREELLEHYPDHWVAIYNQAVVAAAKQLPQLLRKLDKLGVPRGEAFVEHVSGEDDVLVLTT